MGRQGCRTHVFGHHCQVQHQLGWVGRKVNWMGSVLSLLPANSDAGDKAKLLHFMAVQVLLKM